MTAADPAIAYFPHLVIIATCLKLLTLKSYKSTDFDVHRNWMAVTHSLPISSWYTDTTSEWTLDYPPFFAYFEFILARVAAHIDPDIVRLSATPIRSDLTICYQSMTVILSDLVYYFSVYQWITFTASEAPIALAFRYVCSVYRVRSMGKDSDPLTADWFSPRLVLAVLLIFAPGLLIVDHLHFQYNGFLSGLFLLSILCVMKSQFVAGAALFAILLNLKQIYLYVAPAVAVYFLRRHCFDMHYKLKTGNLLTIAVTGIAVFILSLGPFVSQLPQLRSRLFPFKRGLTHAYWAPNVWAIYNAIDLMLAKLLTRPGTPGYTTGLVQEFDHLVLPSVSPLATFLITFAAMIPALIVLWKRCHFTASPNILFLRILILCSLSSFLFSWHVHEKAILMVILPLTPLLILSQADCEIWSIITAAGTFSLFPLLHQSAETPVKVFLSLAYFAYAFPAFRFHAKWNNCATNFSSTFETLYLTGFLLLQAFVSIIFPLSGLQSRLPFLPLAVTSVYCAIGIIHSYVRFYMETLRIK